MTKTNQYLTEETLASTLEAIVKAAGGTWMGTQLRLTPPRRFRYDMAYETIRNGDTELTIVEYDGPDHYQNPQVLQYDEEKKQLIAMKKGSRIIRIPYWVQLTSETIAFYFGFNTEFNHTYAHGFIKSGVLCPASFNERGLIRFRDELLSLPNRTRDDVILSLRDKIKKLGRELVIPASLADIVSHGNGS